MFTPADLLSYFGADLDPSLLLLRRLVELESNSSDKKGIDLLAEFLAREFNSRGAGAEVMRLPASGNALKATCKGTGSSRPVLFLGHLDTVWPAGTLAARPFTLAEGRAYGPGVYDMKGGILLCLLVCSALHERRIHSGCDVIFFFTSDEETGTAAGLPLLRRIVEGCRLVLCLEPPLPGGGVKTSRKGVGQFHVAVSGVAAHAGVDHERGANAILELCRQVVKLHRMTDYERGITVNVGTVRGGSAANVVPDSAGAEVDIRFCKLRDGRSLEKRLRKFRPFDARCRMELTGGINRPPLERTSAILGLYNRAKAVAAGIGMELGEGDSGGGSDGSFTAAMGIPTLDGLGVDGGGAHAVNEHILINDLPRRAALLSLLAQELGE